MIGAGPGGLAAASAAAAFGVNVVLIEKGEMGGESLNCGSLPSKALLAAAERAKALRTGARFGVKDRRASASISPRCAPTCVTSSPRSRRRIRASASTASACASSQGEGRFTDPETVAVNGFDIKARRFVIATGSSPARAGDPGPCRYAVSHQRDRVRSSPLVRAISSSSAPARSASNWRRRFAGSAPKSPCSSAATPLCRRRSGMRRHRARRAHPRRRRDPHRRRDRRRCAVALARRAGRYRQRGRRSQTRRSKARIFWSRPAAVRIWTNLDLDAAGIRYEPDGIAVDRRLRTSNKQRLCDRRRHGRARNSRTSPTITPGLVIRNALFRTPVDADRLCRSLGDLYRSGIGAGRPDRGRGARAFRHYPRAALRPIAKTTARRPPGRPMATSRSSPIAGAIFSARRSSAPEPPKTSPPGHSPSTKN